MKRKRTVLRVVEASARSQFLSLEARMTAQGWSLCAMNDDKGRRGVWMRASFMHDEHGNDLSARGEIHRLEVCAGREGDDVRVTLYRGQVLTGQQLSDLFNALDVGRWMVEDGGLI